MSPSAAPKVCSCPGCASCSGRCPNTSRAGRCDSCKTEAQRVAPHDKTRKKIYNSKRWAVLRRQIKRETAWCAITGCTRPWVQLDHEPPLRDLLEQGLDPYARAYVQPLCSSHHSEKTMREIRARRQG